jgi:glycosyltransferase involved in cell wall biosynthesis
MKRLLFVTSRFPYPPVGGDRLRAFHLARLLARHYEVELLSLGPEPVDQATLQAFLAATGVARARAIDQPRWRSLTGAATALLTGQPLQVGYFRSPNLERAFGQALPHADMVLLHLIRTSALWQRQRPVPAMLDMCDAISENLQQAARNGRWWSPWTWVCRLEAPRLQRFERAQAQAFELVSFVAAADCDVLGLKEPQAFVLTQGVNLQHYAYVPPMQRRGNAIALIGKMDTYPNRSAALWAARELMPLLPQFRLKVVGDCPAALRDQLMALPRVQVTGHVASIAEACSDCFASVAPLDVATGIQNKVLESFALGLPMVLSKSAARGLLPASAGAYLTAETPRQWAEAVQELSACSDETRRMAQQARAYVEQHHTWDEIGDMLYARLEQLQKAT